MTLPPAEPELALEEIQGLAVPGFLKPHQSLLYVGFSHGRGLDEVKGFLRELQVSNGVETLADRRAARATRAVGKTHAGTVLTAIGFTYDGLLRFAPSATRISSPAFKHGLARRSALLGDPRGSSEEGNPKNWTVGAPGDALHAMLVLAGDHREEVSARAGELTARLSGIGATVRVEEGDVRDDLPGHEHFGFDDGISQPGIRGRDARGDFITARHLPAKEVPATWLYGYPGQELIWPGEFVFGYPATGPDPLLPGPVAKGGVEWMENGSFLVYRRLRQDVVAFWQTMRSEANRLATLPGFQGLTPERLAALLVGRWPSGAPVLRSPTADDIGLGKDKFANNDFLFDTDTPPRTVEGHGPYASAKADPAGVTCPWAAHIRKVNTRDSASDLGGTTVMQTRRLLRVGIPFGPALPEEAKYGEAQDPQNGQRGLLFLSIQASIEDQFEFLQARWMNDATRPKTPAGHDMVVGQNAATEDGTRTAGVFGALAQARVSTGKQFVIPTGGGYFFLPSVSALRTVLAGAAPARR